MKSADPRGHHRAALTRWGTGGASSLHWKGQVPMRKHVYFLPLAIGLGFTQASLASANGAIGEPGSTGPESTGSITGLNNVCVDLTGDDVVNGAVNVTIQSCDQQSDESWVFEPNGEIVGAGQKCLTVAGSGASGSNLVLEPCTAGSLGFHPANNQYW